MRFTTVVMGLACIFYALAIGFAVGFAYGGQKSVATKQEDFSPLCGKEITIGKIKYTVLGLCLGGVRLISEDGSQNLQCSQELVRNRLAESPKVQP